ncbi:NifU family protein [Bizionia arctica]|uniref:NifU family protein n=1 Tax=Bizionia arctica TaxID=1495645 RepID=A0A917GAD1_9FLAO|nr:NifU family protein [Bizionia arctica]GGG33825.1 NifU family protein [Bizionia arctica]
MSTFEVSIKETSNNNIIKFEINQFITQHQSFEFNNIDEAKSSPLAQQLFYLPFVKKIYISGNFIAIERYNIIEWKDVQEEVSEQIATYLNSGGLVVEEKEKPTPKASSVSVYAESTPNPTTMKFVVNKRLVPTSYEFTSIEEAKLSPLASELFHFPFVKGVFLDENFVSVTKYDMADWNDITMDLREFIRNYLEQGKEIIVTEVSNAVNKTSEQLDKSYEELDDISKEIISILDEFVKPAVARDGGNIQFTSYNPETKVVEVVLQGACSGCPSSTYTLKSGIENILKEMLQGKVNSVVAING